MAYEKDLRQFAKWIMTERQGKTWSTITRDDIDAWIIHEDVRQMKPTTSNRRLAAVSGIYNWMKRDGKIKENPCRYESRKKIAKRLAPTIPKEELNEAAKNTHGIVGAIIRILYTTGVRISEAMAIRPCDIDEEHQSIKIYGKGAKERIVYTTAETLEELRIYCDIATEPICKGIDERAMRYAIFNAIRPYSKQQRISPHVIRHSFATEMARNGMPTTQLCTLLGHESVKTTQRYVNQAQIDTAAAYKKYQIFT